MSIPTDSVYICSTHRLARATQKLLNQQAKSSKQPVWIAPQVTTLTQWLQDFTTQMLLCGGIPPNMLPIRQLSNFAENLLWQQAIADCLQKHEYAALFNVQSLADAAQAANQLLIEWQIADDEINSDFLSVETRQFLRWRAVFRELCKKHDALEAARILALQADVLQDFGHDFPKKITLLGFDRITPLLQKITCVLQAKGCMVNFVAAKAPQNASIQTGLNDIESECRAAVAWAQDTLKTNPQARLAIVSPVLPRIRRLLQDLLDDTFHPETLHANQAEIPRIYDFSLGEPLAQHPLVSTALNLLRLACNPRARLQADISNLLLDIYWGAWDERDLRAQIDARMRKKCVRNLGLEKLVQLVAQYAENSVLLQNLQALLAFRADLRNRLPSTWNKAFQALLPQLQWANTRALSSHEYQARRAWEKILQQFSTLDTICGNISGPDAVRQLRQMCLQQLHQPESKTEAHILVLGMLEQPVNALDGMWVIGMNDLHWPPPPRPNPLLPYALQRIQGMPGADSAVQAVFGRQIFERLGQSATQVILSYAKHEDDRELRPSPLLADLPHLNGTRGIVTLAEQMATPKKLETLNDHLAPPVGELEQVRGGTKLLEAQAICPAWAFYQYRLGATRLEEPSDGLDQMLRGSLVHATLQQFWETHHDSGVFKRTDLPDLITAAVDAALALNPDLATLPTTLVQIERRRLVLLLETWLALEAERTPFNVHACEQEEIIHVQGLQIRCRIDRIDALEEGLLVIDYKTGTLPKMAAWADERVTEPQLPFYASIVLQNEAVVGACFARVNIEECKLDGASEANIGAGFKPMHEMKSNQTLRQFGGFDALLEHWRTQLNLIAAETVQGVADVRFADEADLAYCDVKPLLRIPERQWQFEQGLNE